MYGTRITTRYKSVVVTVVKGIQGSPDKYLLVKDKKSGDWTFPGGGCRFIKSDVKDRDKYKPCALDEFKEETREALKGHEDQMKYIGQFDSYRRSNDEKKDDKRKGKLGQVRQLYLVYRLPLKESEFIKNKNEFMEKLTDPKYKESKYQETIDVGLFTISELKVLKILWKRMIPVLPIIEGKSQCKRDQCKMDTKERLCYQLKTANRWSKNPGGL